MRIKRPARWSVVLLAAFVAWGAVTATPAVANGPSKESLAVVKAWARATPPGASVGGAYFEIINAGSEDTLVGVECALARRAEVHSMSMAGGMMQMRAAPSVDIPAGGRVVFEPGGLHVMLLDLTKPLQEGQRLPLTLIFRHAGSVHVEAVIMAAGAMSAMDADRQ